MQSYILKIYWLAKPNQTFVFGSMEDAVQSAHTMCARFDRAPIGLDWKEQLEGGEVVRTGAFTMKIEKTEFFVDAITDNTALPEPVPVAVHDPWICYVLMRSDVPSFVNGKAMAQANHAGTAMLGRAIKKEDAQLLSDLNEWMDEADGFGTCITLEVTASDMRQSVSLARLMGLYADIINDPTYPIRDGDKIQTMSVDTCAFVFGRHSQARAAVKGFNLFP